MLKLMEKNTKNISAYLHHEKAMVELKSHSPKEGHLVFEEKKLMSSLEG